MFPFFRPSSSASFSWLYSLLLAEDANFKQKSRYRSSNVKDPALGPGWVTFVNNDVYLNHLSKHTDVDEINHCVSFAALWNANTKHAKGLRAMGIGSVTCACHECFLPNGMGDLQKGERYANIFSCCRCWQLIGSARYANMDFMFLSSVAGSAIKSIIIPYDIACQWGHNFFSCMANMPQHLWILESVKIQFKVLKFHLPAHISKCYVPFSFNFAKWVSRTDGEGVERNWSWLNGIA
jgi:hypothetical protein